MTTTRWTEPPKDLVTNDGEYTVAYIRPNDEYGNKEEAGTMKLSNEPAALNLVHQMIDNGHLAHAYGPDGTRLT